MRLDSPRLSIGLPVYNGERYLHNLLDSLLAQTFTNFVLIISDNASTDGTGAICRAYMEKDARIRYTRASRNMGAIWNHNRAFELAATPYFMWASHDDVYRPTFIARCVEALDAKPEIVLAYTRSTIIDERGHQVSDYNETFRTDSSRPDVRFHDLVRTPHKCLQLFGVIRADVFARTFGLGAYTFSDIVLVSQLGLMGPFHEEPEHLLLYRHHPEQSIRIDRHQRMAWASPDLDTRLTLPQWRLFFELWRCIHQAPLTFIERARCYLTMVCWPFWSRNWRRMGKDLTRASVYVLATAWHLARRSRKRRRPDERSNGASR